MKTKIGFTFATFILSFVVSLVSVLPMAAFSATLTRYIAADADEAQIEYGTSPIHVVRAGLFYIGNYDNVPFPLLYIDDANLRFNTINIPQGSAINSATLSLDITASRAAPVPAQIYALNSDNCAALSSSNFSGDWIANNRLTASRVNWTIPAGVQVSTSPDISGIISELVNRPGWVEGSSICISVAYAGAGITDPDNHHEELVASCGYQDGSSQCGDNTSHPAALTINYSPSTLTVAIDIKPGSYPNTINLGSAGVVPVAILSSPTFDARQIDPATVLLAGAAVRLIGQANKYSCSAKDANGDGLVDLVCHVETAKFLIQPGDSIAVLEAKTFGGQSVRGEDSIRIVP